MITLDWPGCANARDLGGLPTTWGGKIRTGALVRADRPRPAAVRTILDYGVRLVVDLRLAGTECDVDPSPLAGHPVYRNISVLREQDTVLEAMGDSLPAIYRAILDQCGSHLAAVLHAVASAPPGGVLVHCHSGKDRTGLVVALALELAGVPGEEIAADYARTATCLSLDGDAGATSRRLFTEITEDTMRATLDHLREGYGGAQPYLLRAGLAREAVTRLRARLATP